METTVLSESQYANCLGSSRYRICHETMETHLASSSCLATLYFHNTITALTICDTEKILLPSPEKATNLGFCIWLITSASNAFTLREYSIKNDKTPRHKEHKGCNVCIITLECGTQLISKNIKIRPDLGSCDNLPAVRIEVQIRKPLETLVSQVPDLSKLPYYESSTDANIAMLKSVKHTLSNTVVNIESQNFKLIGEPIGHNMTLFRPTLIEKLEMYVPVKLSLSLTLIVFFLNIILHVIAMYLYHRFAIFKKLTPKFLRKRETVNLELVQRIMERESQMKPVIKDSQATSTNGLYVAIPQTEPPLNRRNSASYERTQSETNVSTFASGHQDQHFTGKTEYKEKKKQKKTKTKYH